MTRHGRIFELGQPYVNVENGGACFSWPDKTFKEAFKHRWRELGPVLLERVRHYMDQFDFNESPIYPYMSESGVGTGLTYYITSHHGCGWFTIGDFPFSGMTAFHNMDGYKEWAVGFNTASDTLELLDDTLEAPRALKRDGGYVLRYPLPEGKKVFDAERYPYILDKKWLQERFDLFYKLESPTPIDVEVSDETQEIRAGNGVIHVENGVCESSGFKGFDAFRPGFLIKTLFSSFEDME